MVFGKSIGVSDTVSRYLTAPEKTRLQQLSNHFYHKYLAYIIHKSHIKNIYAGLMVYINYTKKTFCLIDLYDKSKQFFALNYKSYHPWDCTQLMTSDGRYFIGGEDMRYSKRNFYELLLSRKQFVKKASMIERRYSFPLTQIDDNTIIATGGCQSETSSSRELRDCEIYKISENKWYNIASLKKERKSHNSCSFNNNIVYVIGGQGGKYGNDFLSTIEKITFDKDFKGRWEIINVENQELLSKRVYPQAFKLLDKSILIVNEKDLKHEKMVSIYSQKDGRNMLVAIKPNGSLSLRFNSTLYKGHHYWVDSDKNLHMFNEDKWDIIHDFI